MGHRGKILQVHFCALFEGNLADSLLSLKNSGERNNAKIERRNSLPYRNYQSLGDVADMDAHVFIAMHWGVKVEILDVKCHELCIRSGNETIEDDFGSGKSGGFGADFTRVVNAVATNAARLYFLGLIGDYGSFPAWWNFVVRQEEASVCTLAGWYATRGESVG